MTGMIVEAQQQLCPIVKTCSAHSPHKIQKSGGSMQQGFQVDTPVESCLPALGRWTPKGGRFNPMRVVLRRPGTSPGEGLCLEKCPWSILVGILRPWGIQRV